MKQVGGQLERCDGPRKELRQSRRVLLPSPKVAGGEAWLHEGPAEF